MSEISQVVARSRLPGGFSERRTFTLARKRAIQKMREFALADPYYFVLELIQAAVANGATYINLATDEASLTLSYTRGFFREDELGQLFDFLFAGKDRAGIGHVRELALGLNALLLFNPSRIVVESGDGTAKGTTRMVISKGAEHVDIGRADKPLSGTYIRAEGVSRRAVRKKTALTPLPGMPLEAAAIEERCLTAPIPVLVNGTPLFGYTTHRIPRLLGYKRTIELDEGDLFGSLGIHPLDFTPTFKLLTYGVWIQSVGHDLLPGTGVGGIICFDRLHKTADHSGIVHDEVWEEMWARLKPYARQLESGATGVVNGTVTLLGGQTLTARELRPLIRQTRRVVLVSHGVAPESREGRIAAEIGGALEAFVVKASQADAAWIRGLAGSEVAVVRPDLSGGLDHSFFTGQKPCELPARPWLAPPVTVASTDLDSLVSSVVAIHHAAFQVTGHKQHQSRSEAAAALGDHGEVVTTVYTPAAPPSTTRLSVQIVTAERLVWEGTFASSYPGHVLRVELPDLSPSRLLMQLAGDDEAPPLSRYIALSQVHRATSALRAAAGKALSRQQAADGAAPPVLRAIALSALSRSLVSRFKPGPDDVPEVSFSLVERAAGSGLLDRPLLPTLGGEHLSLRQLAALLNDTGGLLYGVIPSVPPALEGLDSHRILQLHADEERLLISLVGDSAYVRVDNRDVLAEHRGVQCRDFALGLHSYPAFPLLVEGVDPSGWPAAERAACVEALVLGLASCYLGLDPSRPAERDALPEWEENRRQACRHLQWFVCWHAARADGAEPDYGARQLPLFLDAGGAAWTYTEVAGALGSERGLELCFRPVFGGSQLGALTAASATSAEDRLAAAGRSHPRDLAASPLTARLLAGLGNVRVALGFDLPHEVPEDPESATRVDFLQRAELSGEGYHGVVGIPAELSTDPEIYVLEPTSGRLHAHHDRARAYGLVGLVRLVDTTLTDGLRDRITADLGETGERLVEKLARSLAALDEDARYHQTVRQLLRFAGARLQLVATAELGAQASVSHPVAQAVLGMPLFPTAAGGLISGERLISAFCSFGTVWSEPGASAGSGRDQVTLSPDAPDYLQTWARRYLNEARVVRPASGRSAPLPQVLERADRPADERIARSVEHWLEELRPDRLGVAVPAPPTFGPPPGVPAEATPGQEAERPRLPIRVLIRSGDVFANFTDSSELMAYTYFERIPTALLNGDHWLVRWAGAALEEPRRLAALLLACYAHINAVLDPVTNLHERVFQVHVARALAEGVLLPVEDPQR